MSAVQKAGEVSMVDAVTTRASGAGVAPTRNPGKPAASDSNRPSGRSGASSGNIGDAVVVAPSITALSSTGDSTAADGTAQRAQDTLSQMRDAEAKAADFTKKFLRQQLDGLKKRLQLVTAMGTDARKVAADSALIARDAAHLAKDYAKAAITKTKAISNGDQSSGDGNSSSASADAAAVADQAQEQAKEQQSAAKLKAAAEQAVADGSGGDDDDADPDAPKNADARFFYDTFKLLAKVKKVVDEAERQVRARAGTQYDKAFGELHKFLGEVGQAVSGSYGEMVGAGVDLTTPSTSSSSSEPLTLRVVA